jgi:hypothetical protein
VAAADLVVPVPPDRVAQAKIKGRELVGNWKMSDLKLFLRS